MRFRVSFFHFTTYVGYRSGTPFFMFRARIRPENHVPRSAQPKSRPRARLTDFCRISFRKTVFHTPSTHLPRIPGSAQRPAYRRPGGSLTDVRRISFRKTVFHPPSTHSPRKPCSAQRPAYRRPGARLTDVRRISFRNTVFHVPSTYSPRKPCSAQRPA